MQNLNERILCLRQSREETEKFIDEYRGFVIANVNKWTGRYVDIHNDDEVSIAMLALYDAIMSYMPEKGNFPPYATQVIKNRLIDHFRKERKTNELTVLCNTFWDDDEENLADYTIEQSIHLYEIESANQNRRMDMLVLEEELKDYHITFESLVRESPKHEKLRKECITLAEQIVDKEDWLKSIKRTKMLPLAEIEKCFLIPRKKLERLRKFIVALVIIKSGDFETIQEFIQGGV